MSKKIEIQMMINIGNNGNGTVGLWISLANGSVLNKGRTTFAEAKATAIKIASKIIENTAKFVEKRRIMNPLLFYSNPFSA
jgi:hypothetical protein